MVNVQTDAVVASLVKRAVSKNTSSKESLKEKNLCNVCGHAYMHAWVIYTMPKNLIYMEVNQSQLDNTVHIYLLLVLLDMPHQLGVCNPSLCL